MATVNVFLAGLVTLCLTVLRDAQTLPIEKKVDARAILARAIVAHGGRENLTKHERIYCHVKGKAGAATLELQEWADIAGRRKVLLHWEEKGQKLVVTRVFDGNQCWEKFNDNETVTGSSADLREAQETLYQARVGLFYPVLEDKSTTLSYLGESKVGVKLSQAVRVKSMGREDVDLYFDKLSGLLLKTECKMFSGVHRGKIMEVHRDEYIERDGIKVAAKVRMILDGRPYSEDEIVEYRAVREFERGTFAKP